MENKNLQKQEENKVATAVKLKSVTPLVDIFENDDEILLHAELPGVKKDGVKINIDNGTLSLSGIRKTIRTGAENWEEFGDVEFQRVFAVPQNIDISKVNAELKDGVLCLHLPKSESAKPRFVEIKAA